MFLHCLKQLHCSRHKILALAYIQFVHLSLHWDVFVISSRMSVFVPFVDQTILGLPSTTVRPNSESFSVDSCDMALPQTHPVWYEARRHVALVHFERVAVRGQIITR